MSRTPDVEGDDEDGQALPTGTPTPPTPEDEFQWQAYPRVLLCPDVVPPQGGPARKASVAGSEDTVIKVDEAKPPKRKVLKSAFAKQPVKPASVRGYSPSGQASPVLARGYFPSSQVSAGKRLKSNIKELVKTAAQESVRKASSARGHSPSGRASCPAEPPVHPEAADEEKNNAVVDGIWRSYGSRHVVDSHVSRPSRSRSTVTVRARKGMPTLRVAYFFSGISGKASIVKCLKRLCENNGYGLEFEEIDILFGGTEHDLLSKETQDNYISEIEECDFDVQILSPPCGKWSRENFADDKPPQPRRNRDHPWGLPDELQHQRNRAETGNKFIKFSIRALAAAKTAKARKRIIKLLSKHPEDFGRTHRGTPASIWQLKELLKLGEESGFRCVAGHQCQYPGVDRKKPTRLLSDVHGIERFGMAAWPQFDAAGYYNGPLPDTCGHKHSQPMIGRNRRGGFNTAPAAAYPDPMCEFLAQIIFDDWVNSLPSRSPVGMGRPLAQEKDETHRATRARSPRTTGPWNMTLRVYKSSKAPRRCAWDGPLRDPPVSSSGLIAEADIEMEHSRLEKLGIEKPLKDELELADPTLKEEDAPVVPTSEEDSELGGQRRPPRGEGWWGVGPTTLLFLRKGIAKPFVDGAGLCSLGRWPIDRRRLPDYDLARQLQKIVLDGILEFEMKLGNEKLPRDLRHVLATMASGKMEAQPFPEDLMQRTGLDSCSAIKAAGFGDGLPQEGDVVLSFEVQILGSLLKAFHDPDAYFGEWWAKEAWLGSPTRKLPRAPAVVDRQTKWRFLEMTEEGKGDWQHNYGSVDEHAAIVQSQLETEEKEGLMARTTLPAGPFSLWLYRPANEWPIGHGIPRCQSQTCPHPRRSQSTRTALLHRACVRPWEPSRSPK